jgi:hypothetical protein
VLGGAAYDTIGDTDTMAAELASGSAGGGVDRAEVSDDPALSKAEQRRRQEAGAAELSYGARIIRIADKTANVRDLVDDPPSTWGVRLRREYLEWTEADCCCGTNEDLRRRDDVPSGRAAPTTPSRSTCSLRPTRRIHSLTLGACPMPDVRPAPDEFAPYYATYVSLVPDGDVTATLASQLEETLTCSVRQRRLCSATLVSGA